MPEIDVLGYVVASEDAWIYRWFGYDCISPRDVRNALKKANGEEVQFRINSYGGLTWAASEIYTDIRNYEGNTVANIVGLAASAAGLIAIAAKVKRMTPLGEFMMHNPWSSAEGDYRAMEAAGKSLRSSRETIINAFALCCPNLTRGEIGAMLNAETWLDARKAVDLGIVDEMMFADGEPTSQSAEETPTEPTEGAQSARAAVMQMPSVISLKAQKAVWDVIAPGAESLTDAKNRFAEMRISDTQIAEKDNDALEERPEEQPEELTQPNDTQRVDIIRAQISAIGAF